eukprot:1193485-Prorocentrum_minimum.AAC.2
MGGATLPTRVIGVAGLRHLARGQRAPEGGGSSVPAGAARTARLSAAALCRRGLHGAGGGRGGRAGGVRRARHPPQAAGDQ